MSFWFQVMYQGLVFFLLIGSLLLLLYPDIHRYTPCLKTVVVSAHVFPTGSSLSDQVHQSPTIFKKQGQEVNIVCSHSIDNYDRILWYKQTKDGQLRFLGLMLGSSAQPEDNLGVRMSGNANTNQNCTLTIKGLSQAHNAVYFCAARFHSDTPPCSLVQKPANHMFSSFI